MKFKITRQAMSAGPVPDDNDLADVQECVLQLKNHEDKVLGAIIYLLEDESKPRDRSSCDGIFGCFSDFVLQPYADAGMVSKAAEFSAMRLIPAILDLEKRKGCEFHKGALFYDTALAFLASGDESRFEYYLAMTDEEDYLTHGVEGKGQDRGMHNKKLGGLTSQTIQASVRFALSLANGSVLSSGCPVATVLGSLLTDQKMNAWRAGLDVFHHAELFRLLNELRVFCGEDVPNYRAVRDNPYVMLRLGKVLAHIAQWAESQLTLLQAGTVTAKTLHPKLASDPHLNSLVSVAGTGPTGTNRFPGKAVEGADIDPELRTLLAEIPKQTVADEKAWRVLRILYIIRNSTAHQIEMTLDFYKDRQYLLDLVQVTLVAAFVIQQRKGIVVV